MHREGLKGKNPLAVKLYFFNVRPLKSVFHYTETHNFMWVEIIYMCLFWNQTFIIPID